MTGAEARRELVIHGIPNCDSVKKARSWLDANAINYTFHDYKKSGVDEQALRRWVAIGGWERVLNRAGTTFRKLSDGRKNELDAATAIALMIEQPSMIKRPIATIGDEVLVGFDTAAWQARLA